MCGGKPQPETCVDNTCSTALAAALGIKAHIRQARTLWGGSSACCAAVALTALCTILQGMQQTQAAAALYTACSKLYKHWIAVQVMHHCNSRAFNMLYVHCTSLLCYGCCPWHKCDVVWVMVELKMTHKYVPSRILSGGKQAVTQAGFGVSRSTLATPSSIPYTMHT